MFTELSDEQKQLQDEAIRFAKSLRTNLVEADRTGRFDREGWQRCAAFGALGMPIPSEYGGAGLGMPKVIAVMEGLGYGTRDHGLLFSMHAHLWAAAMPILLYGTEEQKRRYLPGACDGTIIGGTAASEPDAGSDVFAMKTRAVREGDGYVLDGAKTFVTNAPIADLFVVYATLDPALGPMGITAFVVEADRPGLTIGAPIEKMGLRTSPMAEVSFAGCAIPLENRLGREGRGAAVFESAMEWERGCMMATCLGDMQFLLEQCVEHARRRRQFGKPIGKFQALANLIVAMKVRLDSCRPLVYRIGWRKEHGKPAILESAIAKHHVSECYVASARDAIQVFGGYGYTTEQQIERTLRNAIGSGLYCGTDQIQQNIIARGLGL
ncbi:acyl-CoA dehydrogenase family protein [Pendulispora albinea]|uniref:Acyl-CoA dehydrogenase family protein n=1 Tax=Pendulispora albinea TaxID=2741071 RepID=A0ABZ2MAI6_9BACT